MKLSFYEAKINNKHWDILKKGNFEGDISKCMGCNSHPQLYG
jgi:hypothetical protein